MSTETTRYSFADNPTIFGKILRKEIPADIIYEDAQMLAFKDIHPAAKVHFLVIPKQHLACLRCAGPEDAGLLGYLLSKIPEIARSQGLEAGGYRVLTNAGDDAGQTVPHLHLHVLGGEKLPVMTA